MRVAVAGRRIANLVAPRGPGAHGNPRAFLFRDGKGIRLELSDHGHLLPEGGARVGDELLFQRDQRALKARVTRVEDEHLFEIETDDESKAKAEAASKAALAEANAKVAATFAELGVKAGDVLGVVGEPPIDTPGKANAPKKEG